MCIICTHNYDTSIEELNCANCEIIKELPSNLINLKKIDIHNCKFINKIPDTYINLQKLRCSYTNITEIPSTFIKLDFLDINGCKIKKLPIELNKLKCIYCINSDLEYVPIQYIFLQRINYKNSNINEKDLTYFNNIISNESVKQKKTYNLNTINKPKTIYDTSKVYYKFCTKCNDYFNNKQFISCNKC